MLFIPLIVFAVGLLVGSFLNVVILRMNTGRSVVTGRSKCARCNRTLAWYELVPVLSFLALRGKCRQCRVSISFQYPLVELLTAIVFVVSYTKIVIEGGFTTLAWVSFFFTLVIASLLLVMTVYDLRHKIIPDSVVYPFILLAIASIVWKAFTIQQFAVGGAIVDGVVVALPFFLLWYLSKGRVMGFGDVKLALGIGWLVGLSIGFGSILLAFWIGAVVGLLLLGVTRTYGMKSEVPFAPFLVTGLFIASMWGITIQTLFPLWQ